MESGILRRTGTFALSALATASLFFSAQAAAQQVPPEPIPSWTIEREAPAVEPSRPARVPSTPRHQDAPEPVPVFDEPPAEDNDDIAFQVPPEAVPPADTPEEDETDVSTEGDGEDAGDAAVEGEAAVETGTGTGEDGTAEEPEEGEPETDSPE